MFVVLDANVLVADFKRSGNAFALLLSQAERLGMTIAVPEVALLEAVRQYREQLSAARDKLRRTVGDLSRLGVAVADPFADLGAVHLRAREWETRLRDDLAQPARALLAIPPMEQAKLAAWVSEERPPAHGGSGHGDVLIWESLIAAAPDNQRTVLVSTDGDFAQPGADTLAGELVADFARRRPGASVELVKGLQVFIGRHVLPRLPAVDDFWQLVGQLRHELEHRLAEDIEAGGIPPGVLGFLGGMQAWVIGVEDMSDVELGEARVVPDGKVYFEMLADVGVRVEYLVDPTPGAAAPRREQAIPPYPPHLQHGVDSRWIRVTAEGAYSLGLKKLERFKVRDVTPA